jgi:hypothetical protein
MKREWRPDELAEQCTLLPSEEALARDKRGPTRLAFPLLLKFFQSEGRFPDRPQEVSPAVVAYLAGQLRIAAEQWAAYDWDGRTIKAHRAEIRTLLGFREPTVADAEALDAWLCEEMLPVTHQAERIL